MAWDEMTRILEQMDNLRPDKYPLRQYTNIGTKGVSRVDGYPMNWECVWKTSLIGRNMIRGSLR